MVAEIEWEVVVSVEFAADYYYYYENGRNPQF